MSFDTAQNTQAGVSATSGVPVQGMTNGVPFPILTDGTDGTGIAQPTGGAGPRGWLSGIFSTLLSILTAAQGSIPVGANQIGFVYPSTPSSATSTAANTAIAASIPVVAGQYSYLSGFWIAGLGATAAAIIACNISNVLASSGGNTWNFNVSVPAGVTVPINNGIPIVVTFPRDLQAKAIATAIQVNVGAFGAGNTQQVVGVWGYTSPSAFCMP